MNAINLMLAALLASPAVPAEAVEHPLRVTNERGTAVIFVAPSTGPDKYIADRHLLLDRLAARSPDATLEAQLSFSRHLTSSDLLKELDDSGVTVRTLNFGWDGQSGGFDLREGENLQAALARLHRYHGEFINQMKDSRKLIETETERNGHRPEDKERYERHVEHVGELATSYDAYGVLFTGARVSATASRLRAFRDYAASVRLVDPLWDELSDASGIPDVRKIAIPLPPDAE